MRGLLIGYGSIGRRHLTNFFDLGVTDWAAVRSSRGTVPFEPPCPVRTYTDLGEALAIEKPTFAVVANPSALHAEAASSCLAAGCHVLLEKPVASTPDGLDALTQVAAASQGEVLVAFQFRFHPALQRIRALLDQRVVGRPLHARAVWGEFLPDWHPWEDYRVGYAARADLGGGVHHTICHPIDYLRMLFGQPREVDATLVTAGPLGLEVAEAADVVFGFDDGLTVSMHLDYWSRPPIHRLEVVCEAGSIHWNYLSGSFRWWNAERAEWVIEQYPSVAERNDLFVREARHFLDVVGGAADPVCTLADGVQVVEICAAIERSAAQPNGYQAVRPPSITSVAPVI